MPLSEYQEDTSAPLRNKPFPPLKVSLRYSPNFSTVFPLENSAMIGSLPPSWLPPFTRILSISTCVRGMVSLICPDLFSGKEKEALSASLISLSVFSFRFPLLP